MAHPHFTVVHTEGAATSATSAAARSALVSVVELRLPQLLDSSEFDELNESMLAAVQETPNGGWVIDLTHVSYMGSAMLGLMVNLRQRIRGAGGRLVLCNMP